LAGSFGGVLPQATAIPRGANSRRGAESGAEAAGELTARERQALQLLESRVYARRRGKVANLRVGPGAGAGTKAMVFDRHAPRATAHKGSNALEMADAQAAGKIAAAATADRSRQPSPMLGNKKLNGARGGTASRKKYLTASRPSTYYTTEGEARSGTNYLD
jgi:hypothetical protein